MTSDDSLQSIFDRLVERDKIRPSRVGPIKTALKQYAQILGYSSAGECPHSAYLKEDKARNKLIEEKAPPSLGLNGLRNLKNNIAYILHTAIDLGIVSPNPHLLSWKRANRLTPPRRNESTYPRKYVIDPVPSSLEQEIAEYKEWSTKVSNRVRPRRLRKRPVSFERHRHSLLREAGYLVKYKGAKPDSINFLTLAEPNNAIDFVEWYIEQQGRHTAGSADILSHIHCLGRYLEITVKCPEIQARIQQYLIEIGKFKATLPAPVAVVNKEKRWLTLDQLESVGRSIYPSNAKRIQQPLPIIGASLDRDLNNQEGWNGKFRRYAFRAILSLIIRLVIRIPLRQRNLREMLWSPESCADGQNLYKKDGIWRLRFRGTELKIAERRGQVNSMDFPFPIDLIDYLEEWLYKWRSVPINAQRRKNKGKERLLNGQEFVFVNSLGCPLTPDQVYSAFIAATYKLTGVAMNPHMVRTIFATEYIKETKNFVDAAYMLGDTVQVVMSRYAKLFDAECGERASLWISRKLSGEPRD